MSGGSSIAGVMSALARRSAGGPRALDGFLDSLVQTFENCRPGLPDETAQSGAGAAEPFFRELYQKELPRLVDTVRVAEPLLSEEARGELVRAVDELVRKVVIPAYVRQAVPFTRRERNDFYLLPEPLHGLERLLWSVAGMLVGGFVVWAPFIPVWEKGWIFPFAVAGLLFPNLRKALSLRRYESQLNQLVSRGDREILRLDSAYLTSGEALSERVRRPLPEAAHEKVRD